ncbi:MAG: hypothetical protein K2M82_00725 [Lachnospiraceae bacterium]|nr:hypothetical protein [Lachnospiraceae bacterium]
MKIFKKWLLPVLTCLIAAVAILLPPHISETKDTRLLNGIHTETLAEDRSSLQESSLSQRIELLYLWTKGDKIDALTQRFSEDEMNTNILPVAETALNDLFQEVPAMADVIPSMPEITTGSRLFLRDTASGLSANMLLLQGGQYSHDEFIVELIVDEQTGLVLSFTQENNLAPEGYVFGTYDRTLCAQEYLNYIGIDAEPIRIESENMAAGYRLSECDVIYLFLSNGQANSIRLYDGKTGY